MHIGDMIASIGHQYRVVRLIEIEGESILELQEPGLLPLTPLMKPPSEMSEFQWFEKCVDATVVSNVGSEDMNLLLAAFGHLWWVDS